MKTTILSLFIEFLVNIGGWTIQEVAPRDIRLRYHICSDTGGSLPQWIQRRVSEGTVPNAVVDLVREAKRRQL